ncbi:type VI secretion system tip protein TssI/VgrG [Salmonella enterica]|uniref:Type VI secretion system tip protein VgrG n=1 Tax=Salmonella enterica TaxID=28901 RepID=A0A702E2A7_SALER|nr:type VI secretion system tip protein TssI/VgrG [Salmonella enterica]HAC6565570.1 type VI secretion system tip protein VgrG [Salmonella enterica subsp. indica]HBC0160399.1 type VI secretion system tip protein VgrG [Salmonella enterica subsp. indica]HCM1936156.1 type VI secretion system tip protein VgrG [Salmonella enterica subsp. indica serovar 6,7:z41:1,7]
MRSFRRHAGADCRSIYRQNFRSFQNQNIETILTTLLAENGVTEYSLLLGNKHPVREFCVQYGESDYAFLLRLLSEEGISYFEAFADDGESQWLIFSDDAAHLPPPVEIPFNPNITTGSADEYVSQISHTVQIRPSTVVSKDYTFKRPGWQGKFKEDGANLDWQRNQYEIFDYPGRFKDEQHGRDFTRYQMDGFRSNAETALCESNSPKLWAGQRLTLTEHPLDSLNTTWQVVASELYGEQPQARPGQRGQGTVMNNRFRLIPADTTWRPAPLPKPKVDGPQSARVTGPEGEEIFCDEHGRVRVKFAWDRYNPNNQDSSCWVRVSQAWAGPGFGNLAIPRVGQEVIVDFLNGDPDQPIIMGRTYHQENRSPGSLPATKTQMTIRSKTYKGDGFNELRFEDATSNEQIYMHAQKDHVTEILHDESHTIGNNREKKVGVDQKEEIGQDKQTKVGRDHYETIGRNSVVKVVQDQEIQVDQNRTLVVNSSERKKVFADSSDDIGGHKNIVIQGVKDEQVNTKIFTRTNKYILHAGESATIAGPGGSITIDAGGVTIKAKKLQILTPAMVNEGKPFCEICAKAKKAQEEGNE